MMDIDRKKWGQCLLRMGGFRLPNDVLHYNLHGRYEILTTKVDCGEAGS